MRYVLFAGACLGALAGCSGSDATRSAVEKNRDAVAVTTEPDARAIERSWNDFCRLAKSRAAEVVRKDCRHETTVDIAGGPVRKTDAFGYKAEAELTLVIDNTAVRWVYQIRMGDRDDQWHYLGGNVDFSGGAYPYKGPIRELTPEAKTILGVDR